VSRRIIRISLWTDRPWEVWGEVNGMAGGGAAFPRKVRHQSLAGVTDVSAMVGRDVKHTVDSDPCKNSCGTQWCLVE